MGDAPGAVAELAADLPHATVGMAEQGGAIDTPPVHPPYKPVMAIKTNTKRRTTRLKPLAALYTKLVSIGVASDERTRR